MIPGNDLTADSLFDDRLVCYQNRTGYRFAIDAVLLAHFCQPEQQSHVLDLGAGCGIVSLALAYRHSAIRLTALENQPSLYLLLEKNVVVNNYLDRIRPVVGDLRLIKNIFPAATFDYVFCNPPYRQKTSGRCNTTPEIAAARHEITATLTDVTMAARWCLKNKARGVFVYPAKRLTDLFGVLRSQGLEPKRLQTVHSFPVSPAKLVLVETLKGGGQGLEILPPLYIHTRKNGPYTFETAAMYRP